MKLAPPIFSGSTEPSEAEGWIRKMKSIFSVMGLQDDQKVSLTTFMLKDEASYWWKAIKHLLITLRRRRGNIVEQIYESFLSMVLSSYL